MIDFFSDLVLATLRDIEAPVLSGDVIHHVFDVWLRLQDDLPHYSLESFRCFRACFLAINVSEIVQVFSIATRKHHHSSRWT